MKDKIIVTLILATVVISWAVGLWFLEGGDLRDLIHGCFNAKGCS